MENNKKNIIYLVIIFFGIIIFNYIKDFIF